MDSAWGSLTVGHMQFACDYPYQYCTTYSVARILCNFVHSDQLEVGVRALNLVAEQATRRKTQHGMLDDRVDSRGV